jgi:predicted permease
MAEEMRQHMDELTRQYVADGMPPAEALSAAQRRFGGVAQIEECCRDEHGFVWLGQLLKDIWFATRSLARARGHSLTVLFNLILGIGVTTVVFEITDAIILRASPYPKTGQLFYFGFEDKQGQTQYDTFALQFQCDREQTSVFSEYAAAEPQLCNLVVDGEPTPANIANITDGTFGTLGIAPVLGRGFLPEEFKAGFNNVVVISDGMWRKNFNASADVLGKKLLVDKQLCLIVGVLGKEQRTPRYFGADVYRPLVFKIDPAKILEPVVYVIARLKPGITREVALGALSAVKLPPLDEGVSVFLAGQKTILTKITELDRPDIYWVMFAAAAILYAVACLNAINLMLIRLLGRRRELSIRLAVGGSRWQVVRLLVFESLILSLAACGAVSIAARWFFTPLLAKLYGNTSSLDPSYLNWRTFGCIGFLSIFASIGIALVPMVRLFRADIGSGLKDGGPTLGESPRTRRVRNTFVVLQAAFAVILLIGTGLMVRSFDKLRHEDLGVDPHGKVKVQIVFARGYEIRGDETYHLFERLQRRLSLIPGVKSASFGQDSILQGSYLSNVNLKMADGTYQAMALNFNSADYGKAAGLVMKKGRWLSGKPGVVEVVINEALAKARFGDKDPLGGIITCQATGDMQYPVVGVVKDVRETLRSPAGPRAYAPAFMFPPDINTIILRLDDNPTKELADVVRHAIYEVDPNLIASDIRSIDQQVSDTMWEENYAYMVLKVLSAIALGLTVVGLFSVVAYTVSCRMTEFGVRLAVGATPWDLNGLVMRRGLAAVATGIAIGIAGSLAVTRFMQSLLFETTPNDPIVYAGVAALLVAAGAAACWLPALRAARVDVVRLLRTD